MKSLKLRSAAGPGGGADRISALSDDLLHLVLVRLGCATAAARTSLLSRRWRGLWTCLSTLVFSDVSLPSLEPALACVISSASSNPVSLLDIRLPRRALPTGYGEIRGDVSSLLRTAARLSPEQLVLFLPLGAAPLCSIVELPCFTRATFIELSTASSIILRPPSDAPCWFPELTMLVLTGCAIGCLADLVLRCPRLRVLRFFSLGSSFIAEPLDITVHSASLRELVLDEDAQVRRIDISAPMLEQLTVSTCSGGNVRISVVAPKVEKVSWRCHYGGISLGIGYWTLQAMNLLWTATAVAAQQSLVLLRLDVSDDIFAHTLGNQGYFAGEVEKHLQLTNSSVLALELHLAPLGHVYEALVFYFLEMHPIRTAIQRLKVTLLQHDTAHMHKKRCKEYCGCIPRDWTSKTILMAELKEVEVDGFEGADHEFDFMEHLFSCAPMLKKATLKQSGKVAPIDAKIHGFFKAHPCVECYHVSSSSDSAFMAPS